MPEFSISYYGSAKVFCSAIVEADSEAEAKLMAQEDEIEDFDCECGQIEDIVVEKCVQL